jgi:hypothetical protein
MATMTAFLLNVEKAEPRLLDLAGAAAYLGISRSAIRQLVDNGQLSRVHLPGLSQPDRSLHRFLRDKADLDAFIDRGKER